MRPAECGASPLPLIQSGEQCCWLRVTRAGRANAYSTAVSSLPRTNASTHTWRAWQAKQDENNMEKKMLRTLDQVIASLPASERAKIEARTKQLIAEEMSLQDLRKAIGKTQVALAKRLKVGQDAVSKLETRSDM